MYALKQNPARLWALTRGTSLDMLGSLCAEMVSFAQQEEILLEEKAASFSTHDLETLTRSLIAFKDIAWALQQDVLENVDRIQGLPEIVERSALRRLKNICVLIARLMLLTGLRCAAGIPADCRQPSALRMRPC